MIMLNKLEQYYYEAKGNKWYGYFAIFCRLALAVAWVISGLVKIKGERFAAGLSSNHPLGQYFDALLNTGYYYTFIGVGQVIVALLLLIPRTALLGAISSFPIILNICVLTYSVRFEGTRAATFMLLANLFLLCWDYNRLKSILPFKQDKLDAHSIKEKPLKSRFPFLFFGGVVATLALVVFLNNIIYDIRPGNSPEECTNGCPDNSNPKACQEFCDCIHNKGKPIGKCLEEYEKAK
ncbi:DoxX family protein [Runella rosea]|uniref:DoxX family protein n=1 Tax=Runella rosea TaxID=2259595 RepID=A0A344TS15_9BACT|nr:DoxX family protein [Runella rosea]